MYDKYAYWPIPNVNLAMKIRLREHFTAEILDRQNFHRRPLPTKIKREIMYVWQIRISTYTQRKSGDEN